MINNNIILKYFYPFILLLAVLLFNSCTTDITDWVKTEVVWAELPDEVKKAMVNALKHTEADMTTIPITSLDKGISVSYEWIKAGAGTGSNELNINGKKYNLCSPCRGNEQNEPYVLFKHKLYYLKTLNANSEEELKEAEFGYFNFDDQY